MTQATRSLSRFSDATVVLVECRLGVVRYFAEREAADADLETTIRDFMSGQFDRPVRVIACDPSQGHSSDISEDVALEIKRRAELTGCALGSGTRHFISEHTGYLSEAAE